MNTILLLIVLYHGDLKYMAEGYFTPAECNTALTQALDQFRAINARVVRAECIALGREV